MALFDVSKTITVFQRLCQFAEEFTDEYREPLVSSLTELFQEDLQEGEDVPDVRTVIRSLLRRLRRTLDKLVQSETELIVANKDNTDFSTQRQTLTQELREVFERARTECRNHFGRAKASSAGFPDRLAVNSGALLRQCKVVSWKLRLADFSLGTALVPNSIVTVEYLLNIFEPKVEELRAGLANAVRRQARIQGKQVAKNKEMSDFRSTYSLFVAMVRSSFRLAGQSELAQRLTLTQPSRRATTEDPTPDDAPSEDEPSEDEPPSVPPGPGPDSTGVTRPAAVDDPDQIG